MNYLITGCAGFIGYSLAKKLLQKKNNIYGVDIINSYYSKKLKFDRLKELKNFNNFKFFKQNCSQESFKKFFLKKNIDIIIHLAAEVGVRNSFYYPERYYKNNIKSFYNVLEICRKTKAKLIYASSSSVYGNSKKMYFKESDHTSQPMSFYAATKKCNEVMAHAYSATYNLSITGLRFFNVYGPWGRPDMSIYKFSKAMLRNKNIKIYGTGKQIRDFTYIDDAIQLIERIIHKKLKRNKIPFDIFNTGKGKCISINNLIILISNLLNKKPKIIKADKQMGDLPFTNSSNKKISENLKFKPKTSLKIGVKKFLDWYKTYNK